MNYLTRLHQRLQESRAAAGVSLGLNSPAIAELLVGNTQLDFIIVDMQHAPIGADGLYQMLRAIQAADPMVTPLVRVPNDDVNWIQQSLDAGYAGIIVPLVESAKQVQRIVQSTYLPPLGNRSIAYSIRSSLYTDYFEIINRRMILLPQIKSCKGLENIEEVVAVEGVTGVFLGTVDLCFSCGWKCKDIWENEYFVRAAQRISKACKR